MTDNAQTLVRNAQMLQRLGRVPEAVEAYTRILDRWPDLADCWYNLAVLQKSQRRLEEALDSYQKALDHNVASPEEVHLNRGVIYSDFLRRPAEAEQELNRALALNPNYVPALLNLANLNEDLGRRPQANALYRKILSLDPRCHEALARYANLQPASSADEQLLDQLHSAVRLAASLAERASLGFALGRLLDGKARYPAAFEAYTAANAASRASTVPGTAIYDRRRQEELVDLLIRSTPVRSSTATADSNTDSPQPIFICGLFRSGSTLTEQLLAGHDGLIAGGELDLLPRLAGSISPFPQALASLEAKQLAGLAARYLEELRKLFPGARYVTDKRLDNFLLIGFIKGLFPRARIVHTTRDSLDNCLSIFFLHLDQRMSYALDLLDIGHYYRQYRRIMDHWRNCFPEDIFEMSYDLFVREPSVQARKLFDFLGLQWNERYLSLPGSGARAVKTASVWQVRESIYTRSSGRAMHYRTELAELREYLSDLLPR